MTVQQLKTTWDSELFIPFRIHYPGGPVLEVPHPEYMSFSPTGRIVTVLLPDERLCRVDVALITAIEELQISAEK